MKFVRFALSFALAGVLSTAATLPAFAQTAPAPISRVAPADEYFGPLHLSVMGIRNSIALTGTRLDLVGLDTGDTLKNVALVEASIRDWETQYPGDTWLPKVVLALHRVYARIPDDRATLHAVDIAAWLLTKYPASDEAREVRAQFAAKFGAVSADPNPQ